MANELYDVELSALQSKNALHTAHDIKTAYNSATSGQVLAKSESGYEFIDANDDDAVKKSDQATKTSQMTTPVGIDANGKLWSVPGGGGGGGGDMYKVTYDPDDAVAEAGGIAAYVAEHGGGAVESVNGQTGVVVLDAEDVGALPDDTPIFSGDYNDLTNKPTLATVATTGSYNDLSNKPTIPTVATYTATLNTTWSGSAAPYSKEQTISGILASDTPIIDIIPSSTYETAQTQEEGWSKIYRAVCAADKITFYATEKPTVSLPIKVTCLR